MKNLSILFLSLILSIGTLVAEKVQIGNLYYNLDSTTMTAEVTSQNSGYPFWSTSIIIADIPASLTYNMATYSVTSIGTDAFNNCSDLTSVTIPSSIISIGNRAFQTCTNLSLINIPNSVISIGDHVFYGCESLTYPIYNSRFFIYMPTSFYGAYVIPDGVESIVSAAFENCNSLYSITIPNSVSIIEDVAFNGCTSLRSIEIPSSVTNIGIWAFYNCNNLRSVTMYSTTPPALGVSAFSYTADDPLYPVPLNIIIYVPCGTIDSYLDSNEWSVYASKITSNLKSYKVGKVAENGFITTTDTVFDCDEPAIITCTAIPFQGCSFIHWADGNTDNPRIIELTQDTTIEAIFDFLLGGICGHDSVLTWSLDTATMALDITGTGALSNIYTYSNLIESVTIGNSVTSIGQYAFDGCNHLKNVVIGSSVRVIEDYAFRRCTAIETITCYSQRPPTVNTYAFDNLPYSTIVYVPAEYLSTYQMHNFWGLYDVRPLGSTTGESITVQYTDNNGVFMSDETIVFHFPVAPQIEGFTFLGWQPIAEIIDNIITIQAVYEAQNPTSAPAEVSVPGSNGTLKLIQNGNVYILRDGKTYTLQGQEVK